MKKILVTGASGFIGKQTIRLLEEKGYEVCAIYFIEKPSNVEGGNINWYRCNLLNPLEQQQLFSEIKPSHLLHLAWYTAHNKYWTSPENLKWVQASLGLLVNFANHGGIRAVIAGSSAEYNWSYGGYCSENETPLKAATLYGTCKNSLNEILQKYTAQTGISYAWGRVFFLYGPYEYSNRLIASFIKALLEGQSIKCVNSKLICDFLYVLDTASAFVSLVDSNVSGSVNIASGIPISIGDIVNIIAEKLNKRELVEFGENHSSLKEKGLLVADINRLKMEVGWTPNYDLNKGLDETIDWWKNHLFNSNEHSNKVERKD